MIKSMTGYGRAEAVTENGKYVVEIKSLNAKGTDIYLKSALIPKDKDIPLRKKLTERLLRGTIDLYLSFEAAPSAASRTIDSTLVGKFLTQLSSVGGMDTPEAKATLTAAILRFPEFTDSRKADSISEEDWPAVEAAIDRAIDMLDGFRSREGAILANDITSRVNGILALYNEVESLESERIETTRARILKKLEELGAAPDPSRFEQELVYYLDKFDITEEKVRLRQHCSYFLETIRNEEAPGKKLGFIIQEMGREINTTGSKANHAGIQKLVVRMKDELEKIREQSMNIL